jgi:hypothetical protein
MCKTYDMKLLSLRSNNLRILNAELNEKQQMKHMYLKMLMVSLQRSEII